MAVDILEQGTIIWVNFQPVKGHEQDGIRPALVVSISDFQRLNNLIMVMPISNRKQSFPMHVPLDSRTQTTGSILTEHIKSIDPNERLVKVVEMCPNDKVQQALDLLYDSTSLK
ncbi:type II toxin-antitoxin system PemK/MazF family toxin [Lactiplantibacillus plantarum]|uniref:type II toxin-antitoxin system PemK/MazF family toxin n=1 Tax=Lactiplantibacillus plantarum TaxID=1590 RepID=UPI000FF6B67E|nr:type II toxin-antitoxin system PemK/MazF family toxin [Lactiplantibacillus plantarum]RWU86452.1 type II toxin-antitoxin system PemK/MazF family toxin [Lactiplantibacillus plantarum]RXS45606.1 type II toxin-antitoxin system PemK/MazF family toxin [Lactiplantibacillus plantarum]